MKVVATKIGFLDGVRRRPGVVFDVPDTYDISKCSWLVRVDEKNGIPEGAAKEIAKAASTVAPAEDAPRTFSEIAKGKASKSDVLK